MPMFEYDGPLYFKDDKQKSADDELQDLLDEAEYKPAIKKMKK